MTTVTISLPESLKEFIDTEVQTKGYGNVSEYMRGLLRAERASAADARLETLLLEGLSSGDDIALTPQFWRKLKLDAVRILESSKVDARKKSPKMKFVLRPAANKDILAQFEYYLIEQGAEAVANRFLAAVQSEIAAICSDPQLGSPKHLSNAKLSGLRSWPVKGFTQIRVHYLVSKSTVRILRVLHGKRDVDSILEGR